MMPAQVMRAVLRERDQLDAHLRALNAFLTGRPMQVVDLGELERLTRQLNAMVEYNKILTERLVAGGYADESESHPVLADSAPVTPIDLEQASDELVASLVPTQTYDPEPPLPEESTTPWPDAPVEGDSGHNTSSAPWPLDSLDDATTGDITVEPEGALDELEQASAEVEERDEPLPEPDVSNAQVESSEPPIEPDPQPLPVDAVLNGDPERL